MYKRDSLLAPISKLSESYLACDHGEVSIGLAYLDFSAIEHFGKRYVSSHVESFTAAFCAEHHKQEVCMKGCNLQFAPILADQS